MRDGIIEAVGADIKIPLDAWLIDGNNLSVYPGLIDSGSDTGLTLQVSWRASRMFVDSPLLRK